MRTQGHVVVLIAIILATTLLEAKKYCMSDDDCNDLGSLVCIKSACDRGICSCPRGRAAKYMGSSTGFKCVRIRRIGESCSNKGDTGVCGPDNSFCNETRQVCECDATYVPKAGGEMCVLPNEQLIGETCSPGGIGDTCIDSQCRSQVNSGDFWSRDINFNMPTCACAEDEELQYTNALYVTGSGTFQEFVAAREPICVPRTVGSSCVRNTDCQFVSSSLRCQNNVCVCSTGTHVQDYAGTRCGTPLTQGQNCSGIGVTGICNGAQGLTCGDTCDPTDDAVDQCVCGPFHTGTTTCTLREEGSPCYGDFNCKGWKLTAVCVDGSCQDGAAALTLSIATLLISLIVHM